MTRIIITLILLLPSLLPPFVPEVSAQDTSYPANYAKEPRFKALLTLNAFRHVIALSPSGNPFLK